MLVAKVNDMEMKGQHEKNLREFYKSIGEEGEFDQKVSGYCCIYAPYYIHFFETEDE